MTSYIETNEKLINLEHIFEDTVLNLNLNSILNLNSKTTVQRMCVWMCKFSWIFQQLVVSFLNVTSKLFFLFPELLESKVK